MWLFLINPLKLCSYGSWSLQGYVCKSSCCQCHIYIYTLAWILKCLKLYPSISLIDDSAAATQPLCQSGWCSHSATLPEWLEQPLSHSARVADAATQPLCRRGWRSHSATQPLCQSGWSSHSATQSLCQSGWSSHSATQSLCQSGWSSHSATLSDWVAEWLRQPLCQSGWVADVKISAIARSIWFLMLCKLTLKLELCGAQHSSQCKTTATCPH